MKKLGLCVVMLVLALSVVSAGAQQESISIPAGMVRINGGTFMMGSPASEINRERWEVQHQVTISKAFYMGKYEVTRAEYDAVMGTNESQSMGPNHPVSGVTWYKAIEYCNKRSQMEGLTAVYTIPEKEPWGIWRDVTWDRNANGYRLPTEAEWEYACRAGTTGPYYSGSSVDDAGWYKSNSGFKTHPVGEKKANAWGLYDMHGNVCEWCWDRVDSSNERYSNGPQTDPVGPDRGGSQTVRVIRGGDWEDLEPDVRSASRSWVHPTETGSRFTHVGFRVVRSL